MGTSLLSRSPIEFVTSIRVCIRRRSIARSPCWPSSTSYAVPTWALMAPLVGNRHTLMITFTWSVSVVATFSIIRVRSWSEPECTSNRNTDSRPQRSTLSSPAFVKRALPLERVPAGDACSSWGHSESATGAPQVLRVLFREAVQCPFRESRPAGCRETRRVVVRSPISSSKMNGFARFEHQGPSTSEVKTRSPCQEHPTEKVRSGGYSVSSVATNRAT